MRLKLTFRTIPGGSREAIVGKLAYCVEIKDYNPGYTPATYRAVVRRPNSRHVVEQCPTTFHGISNAILWLRDTAERRAP